MSNERVITPRSYTYGRLAKDANRIVYIGVGEEMLELHDITRYYINNDGNTLTIFAKGQMSAVVKIVWSKHSDRIIIRTGGRTIVAYSVSVKVTENDETIITA